MTIPKAVDAEKVISERFPEFLKKESKAWCIFATVILLSETVKDVYHFYQSLMTANSDCNRHDITDAMYCVASFLFHFKITFGINYGLHYRVYSALYWMENESFTKEGEGSQTLKVVKGLPGQQSIHSYGVNSKLHLTNEQLRILNHKLQPGNILKINALAGTGKTTTIIHLAQLYPQMKFLNIMFNKAVCEEAKKRFPLNVTCKTAHSIAYAQWGFRLKHKLSSKLRPHDLVPDLEYYAGLSVPIHTHAKYVLSTVEAFIQSDDSKFLIDHVPNNFGQSLQAIANHRSLILKDADQIWQKMIDKDNKSQRITHDVYLKLYQLSKPKIIGYDCIMVDEAQDSNPAMLDIVMSQRLPVILVGDPNQQIYGFRGAKNALQNIRSTHTYCLTKSFRFGPEIAYIASCCLEVLNSSIFTTLVGSKQPSCIDGKLIGQYAIIARTNVQLFNEAFRLCVQKRFKSFEPQIIHGCFAGGIASYGFDQIIEISNMANYPEKEPPKVRDKFLSKFRSYKALTSYARSVEDHDLLTKIELVNQHGSQIIKYIEIIKEKCSHNIDLANVVFTTAHKSKGLEFDTVCLTNDFFISIDIDFLNRPRHKCEENSIMYVAVTRAKKSLILSDQLLKACLGAQEKFEYPVRTTQVKTKENPLRCVSCSTEFNPHTALTLVRRELILANGNIIEGGPLCIRCASKTHFRPRHDMEALVMYLDPLPDYAHRSMAALVGPLPTDPPLDQDTESFNENGQVFHINVFF
ncbi:f-box DNA helicase 1 [Caerostris darwini]|uniref:DNA 3'-5' helicase n=1 Tax=Caerostris darwini TaxID=1538125 RepID=A0AAV4N9V3_9ARAC|nr:f-box DNA helicase 1 [Caerostris darwini]